MGVGSLRLHRNRGILARPHVGYPPQDVKLHWRALSLRADRESGMITTFRPKGRPSFELPMQITIRDGSGHS
ncbi:MAG: hypothetical protein ACRDOA_09995 [Streptosporangiaceae bacterium]